MPRAQKRRAQPPSFSWRPNAFLGTSVGRSDGRELYLHVAGGGEAWMAFAFEGPEGGTAHAILGDHAHRLVGEFANPAAAQRAAEGFAKKWLRGEKIDECDCEDVET